MNRHELRSIVSSEINSAVGYFGSELEKDQQEALKRYKGEPYGNEVEGRSKVVSRDIMEVVEWTMPQLMRIFMSSDRPVECKPHGPEDVEAMEQASDYLAHVFFEDNDGFTNLYDSMKDGLVERVGVLKVWWEDQEEFEKEDYEGLTLEGLAAIVQQQDVEILAVEESEDGTLSATVQRPLDTGRVKVEPVPSNEFLISRDAKSITQARFVAHRSYPTRSDLIADGYDKETVMALPTDTGDDSEQAYERSVLDNDLDGNNTHNPLMETVEFFECYLRVDVDGDGIAEMRKVEVAGSDQAILSDEEWGGSRPFAAWTPIPMPHKFYGMSYVDILDDLQRVKTQLTRLYLDGLYVGISPQKEVNVDVLVDETGSEVMDVRPNSVIRKKGVEPAVTPVLSDPGIPAHALTGLQTVDGWRENRTGVSQRTLGLSDDTLHDTKGGQDRLMTMAMGRVELIARCYGENLLKSAFELIYELLHRYQDRERVIRLRNKWVPIDPRSWRSKADMKVTVGLGNGSAEQQAASAASVIGVLEKVILMQKGVQGPLVTLDNVHHALSKFIEAAGYKDVDSFLTDPSQAAQGADPQVMEMAKVIEAMKAQIAKLSDDREIKVAELKLKSQQVEIERFEAETDRYAKTKPQQMDDTTQEVALDYQKFLAELRLQAEDGDKDRMLDLAKHLTGMGIPVDMNALAARFDGLAPVDG